VQNTLLITPICGRINKMHEP